MRNSIEIDSNNISNLRVYIMMELIITAIVIFSITATAMIIEKATKKTAITIATIISIISAATTTTASRNNNYYNNSCTATNNKNSRENIATTLPV